jgi:hypothetical protein
MFAFSINVDLDELKKKNDKGKKKKKPGGSKKGRSKVDASMLDGEETATNQP